MDGEETQRKRNSDFHEGLATLPWNDQWEQHIPPPPGASWGAIAGVIATEAQAAAGASLGHEKAAGQKTYASNIDPLLHEEDLQTTPEGRLRTTPLRKVL